MSQPFKDIFDSQNIFADDDNYDYDDTPMDSILPQPPPKTLTIISDMRGGEVGPGENVIWEEPKSPPQGQKRDAVKQLTPRKKTFKKQKQKKQSNIPIQVVSSTQIEQSQRLLTEAAAAAQQLLAQTEAENNRLYQEVQALKAHQEVLKARSNPIPAKKSIPTSVPAKKSIPPPSDQTQKRTRQPINVIEREQRKWNEQQNQQMDIPTIIPSLPSSNGGDEGEGNLPQTIVEVIPQKPPLFQLWDLSTFPIEQWNSFLEVYEKLWIEIKPSDPMIALQSPMDYSVSLNKLFSKNYDVGRKEIPTNENYNFIFQLFQNDANYSIFADDTLTFLLKSKKAFINGPNEDTKSTFFEALDQYDEAEEVWGNIFDDNNLYHTSMPVFGLFSEAIQGELLSVRGILKSTQNYSPEILESIKQHFDVLMALDEFCKLSKFTTFDVSNETIVRKSKWIDVFNRVNKKYPNVFPDYLVKNIHSWEKCLRLHMEITSTILKTKNTDLLRQYETNIKNYEEILILMRLFTRYLDYPSWYSHPESVLFVQFQTLWKMNTPPFTILKKFFDETPVLIEYSSIIFPIWMAHIFGDNTLSILKHLPPGKGLSKYIENGTQKIQQHIAAYPNSGWFVLPTGEVEKRKTIAREEDGMCILLAPTSEQIPLFINEVDDYMKKNLYYSKQTSYRTLQIDPIYFEILH